jgi:Bacterial PH domain
VAGRAGEIARVLRGARVSVGFVRRFPAAPWPPLLKATSAFATILILAAGYVAARVVPPEGAVHVVGIAVACLPVAVLVGALLFVVRAYEVDQNELRVARLLWPTVLPVGGLRRIWRDPQAMKGSIRIIGDGGLYEVTGLFRNRRLGNYRAFVTDPRRSVVMALPPRVIVVTPADPEGFVEHVRTLFPTVFVGPPSDPREP